MSTFRPLMAEPWSDTVYTPEYLPASMIRTRVPIGRTLGSAAMVVPTRGLSPSEVSRPLEYAKARNFRAFRCIETSGCLCLSSATVVFGDSSRLSTTSSWI